MKEIKIILLYSLLFANLIFAHKVDISAYVENNTVYTESCFSDGKKVEGGRIEVYDSLGNKLLEGKTNGEGQFSFKPPKRDDLKIVLVTSCGHKAFSTILKEELPDKASLEVSKEFSYLEQIKRIIDTSLDEKLKVIIKEIKREKEERYFREIIAGIGYIFGTLGVILYFITRKKRA
jgi:nickel transport protein